MTPHKPFRGLEPFRAVDAPIFCERDRETIRLLQLIALYRGVLLYGDSGVGKSSLVNAGLLPSFDAEGLHGERIRFQPIPGSEIVIERTANDLCVSRFLSKDNRAVRGAADFRREVVEMAHDLRQRDNKCLLLIFDQFEEIVTLTAEASQRVGLSAPRRAQQAVVRLLIDLLHDEIVPVKVLFVFREDYLAKIARLFSDVPNLIDQYMRLEAVRTKRVRHIVEGPFENVAFEKPFSQEIADAIVAAIERRYSEGYLDLSAVQVVCLQLWQSVEPPLDLLRVRGVDGLVEDFLADGIERMPLHLRQAAITLLCHMVTATGTRNVISYPDLIVAAKANGVSQQLANEALDALETEAHVVTRDARRDVPFYEIVSEFLVPWIMRQRDERREHAFQTRRRKLLVATASVVILLSTSAWITFYASLGANDERMRDRVASVVETRSTEFLSAAKLKRQLLDEQEERARLQHALGVALRRAERAERELRERQPTKPEGEVR